MNHNGLRRCGWRRRADPCEVREEPFGFSFRALSRCRRAALESCLLSLRDITSSFLVTHRLEALGRKESSPQTGFNPSSCTPLRVPISVCPLELSAIILSNMCDLSCLSSNVKEPLAFADILPTCVPARLRWTGTMAFTMSPVLNPCLGRFSLGSVRGNPYLLIRHICRDPCP